MKTAGNTVPVTDPRADIGDVGKLADRQPNTG